MKPQAFRLNNFDLLRLIAALQVVINHTIEILAINPSAIAKNLLDFSHLFPGVPIFFFISGFLISKSYESNHKLSEYFQNRALRLYPGLVACVTLSFILIYVSGYMATAEANVLDWSILYLSKTTIVQFYNPEFMRAYGDGVLNGSLWTITVELQFYFLVPVVYLALNIQGFRTTNFKLIVLILAFLLINRVYTGIPSEYQESILYKLLRVSFAPWFYMFLVGVLVQKNIDFFYRKLAGKFFYLFTFYCVIGYLAVMCKIELGNNINPVLFIVLAGVAFSFAYSFSGLSQKLLRGNDISYGAYIYHMPIINFILYHGYSGDMIQVLYVLVITITLALVSWIVIEKKSLALKKHPLNPLNKYNN